MRNEDWWDEGESFEELYEEQQENQRYWDSKVGHPSNSITEVADEVMRQQQYLMDEVTEVLTALGGQLGKAAWKSWKADHAKASITKLSSLNRQEHDDLVSECADVMIFAMNIAIHCGIDSRDLSREIALKQEENVERWDNQY